MTRIQASRQRGFTLIEVLVALVVFAISVVGLVALESRSIEAQKSAANMREAERVAQEAMQELMTHGFLELVQRDFSGNNDPMFPYDDSLVAPGTRLAHFRRPPVDLPSTTDVVGSVPGQYIVFRTVDWIIDTPTAPPNPPVGQPEDVHALSLDVLVMWIDDTNPSMPPPDGQRTIDLLPAMTVPGDPSYAPHVGYVRLRTVRVNDSVLEPPP